MKISPITNILTNPKAAEFAQNTICAISVETTLKALGRPTFIYFDKNANGRSKKYAATKELLYQSFCLGLYLGFINKVNKPVYKLISNKFFNNEEDKRKLNLYDTFQKKIDTAPTKDLKKSLRAELGKLIRENKDYKLGKGVHEFSSIISTVFILAGCAPILSQIILHPVMDLIFKKGKNTKKAESQGVQAQTLKKDNLEKISDKQTKTEKVSE